MALKWPKILLAPITLNNYALFKTKRSDKQNFLKTETTKVKPRSASLTLCSRLKKSLCSYFQRKQEIFHAKNCPVHKDINIISDLVIMRNSGLVNIFEELTEASKSKRQSSSRGHSRPHLHVPSLIRYSFTSSFDFKSIPLGLKITK